VVVQAGPALLAVAGRNLLLNQKNTKVTKREKSTTTSTKIQTVTA
jgi:hypothetical protein